jgi:hypothetical protein
VNLMHSSLFCIRTYRITVLLPCPISNSVTFCYPQVSKKVRQFVGRKFFGTFDQSRKLSTERRQISGCPHLNAPNSTNRGNKVERTRSRIRIVHAMLICVP